MAALRIRVLGLATALVAFASCQYGAMVQSSEVADKCVCPVIKRPAIHKKELTARWMVHTLDWGVISTISSRLPGAPPFGNVYSFVDGSCEKSSGTPYFYGTYMDQTFKDMLENPKASLTLSEATLASVCGTSGLAACSTVPSGKHVGDPESPICARLTITGTLVQVDRTSEEFRTAMDAFYLRHPQMEYWPSDHDWIIAKLEIEDIWLIDFFGGASILDIDKYYAQDLFNVPAEKINV